MRMRGVGSTAHSLEFRADIGLLLVCFESGLEPREWYVHDRNLVIPNPLAFPVFCLPLLSLGFFLFTLVRLSACCTLLIIFFVLRLIRRLLGGTRCEVAQTLNLEYEPGRGHAPCDLDQRLRILNFGVWSLDYGYQIIDFKDYGFWARDCIRLGVGVWGLGLRA